MSNQNKHNDYIRQGTAPEAPELQKKSKLHKQNRAWVSTLARFSRPLAALVIVFGLATVGYFGFVRSSADTKKFDASAVRADVDCKNPKSDKCKEKKQEAVKEELKDFKNNCAAANLTYNSNTKSCGGCMSGYTKVGGSCQAQKEVNCAAQNRKQDGKYDCGGCAAGYSANVNGACVAKVNCKASGLEQKTDFECKKKCADGYAKKGDDCQKLVDCGPQNLKQIDEFTCGDCKKGYSTILGKCVSNTQMANLCLSAFKNYDPATGSCKGCVTGYTAEGSSCVKDKTVTLTKADCDAQHRTFNNGKCGGCVAGFTASSAGACLSGASGAFSCKPGEVFVNNKCQKSVEASCDATNQKYAKEKNECRAVCLSGFYVNTKGECVSVAKIKEDVDVKKTCDDSNQVYDKLTNSCTKTCVEGYYLKNKVCEKIPAKVYDCDRNAKGVCRVDEDAVKEVCKGQHREYNKNTNSCRKSCADGYYARDGVCKKVGDGEVKAVKNSCEKANLTYDAAANICKPNCKAGYVMRDGTCVPWEDASMSKARCKALGREWVPGTPATDEAEAVAGSCATICRDAETTTYTDTNNQDTSYCLASETTVGAGGVTMEVTKEQCKAENRGWIAALNACSARCKAGFYLSTIDNKCTEIIPALDENLQGTGDEGNGTTDGCQADLQRIAINRSSGVETLKRVVPGAVLTEEQKARGDALVAVVCPDDVVTEDPAENEEGTAVVHETESGISKADCSLLGRVWVPKSEVDGKKVPGGCSMNQCQVVGASVLESHNSAYCEGSVVRISEQKCDKLNRIWSPVVNGCIANPVQDETTPTVAAKQCVEPYTVYIHHDAEQGYDECVTPTAYERIKAIAKEAGETVSTIASLPAKAVCALRSNMMWDGDKNKCVKQRIADGVVTTDKVSDNFGNKYVLADVKYKPVDCSKIKENVSKSESNRFTCVSDNKCEQAGGKSIVLRLAGSTAKEKNVVLSSSGCWVKGTSAIAVSVDTFGAAYVASETDYDGVQCDVFRNKLSEDQKQGIDCKDKNSCKESGGKYIGKSLYLEDAERIIGAYVCTV